MTVEVQPVGKGRRSTTLDEVATTVRVRFRDYAPVFVNLDKRPGRDFFTSLSNQLLGAPGPLSEEAAAKVAGATVPVEGE